ncbi:putative ssDNA binding protein [Pantoea phage vB_PagS_AAS21]|uniref:Putative ssDNA binding protein n=1 Tax=Pantoea phage vB_PagS_AAS21 TaxID=2575261 RepID=A0A4Y5P1F0_9CAUD|nr:putative ssDNA binding protein [Pantoea phage vB_PagS_AAS21]
MAKSWGSTKGTTSNDKLDYMSFKSGKNTIRIVSPVLPRYVYWLKNPENKAAPFECLRFNRDTEKFLSGARDPIHDLGFKEAEADKKTGKVLPLKPKKNYVCWVIDRADNKLKIMDVKATILKGIQSTMGQLDLSDPTEIDFVIEKTGKMFDTEYKVLEIEAMKFQQKVTQAGTKEFEQYQKDEELIGERFEDPETEEIGYAKVPSLDETFTRPTYEEQYESAKAFSEGRKDEDEGEDKADEPVPGSNASEAVNDLDE